MARDSAIGIRIRTARRRAGLTQAQLAEVLNVGRSAVGNWEGAAGVQPSSARLRDIAITVSVSYEWLATGRGDPGSHQFERAAVDAELVDDPVERRLLKAFRCCKVTARLIVLQMIESQIV
ncbi:MAG TPA: helix-turn-helix domain-containing protein [Stenotrophomonas sp.]|nr:helix-turn-helix domain-containing protein [Stenotrophomonas sp.]